MPEIDLPGGRLPSAALVGSGIGSGAGKPGLAAGLLCFLLSIGIVGAVIVAGFGMASFSSLHTSTSRAMPAQPVGGEGNQVPLAITNVFPRAEVEPAQVKPEASLSRLDGAATALPSPPPQRPALPSNSAMPEIAKLQPNVRSASPEERAAPEPEARAIAAKPPPTILGEQPDQLFREFEVRQNRQSVRPPDSIAEIAKTPIPSAGQIQPSDHPSRGDSAFLRSAIRRECGPITDRALRRECVASFATHYPVR